MSPKDDLEIRSAAADDYAQILDWHRQTIAEHAARLPHIFDSSAISKITEKDLRRLFRRPFGKRKKCDDILVAYADDIMIGYIWCQVARNRFGLPDVSRPACIYDVFVIEEARRRGVGSRLLAAAQTYIRKAGISKVHAIVWGENLDSQALFENQMEESYRRYEAVFSEPVVKKKTDWLFIIALTFVAAWVAAAIFSRSS